MYHHKTIAVVVPAFNEEKLIGRVIETMPDLVDRIIIVDDASQDNTYRIASAFQEKDDRIRIIQHERNRGVGGAVISGHRSALQDGMDIVVVMAGDAQMNPADLTFILDPLVKNEADYAKGNRFINGEAWKYMPRTRFFANAGLSMLNKIASGFWQISDPQCGYTAISSGALKQLDLDQINPDYTFENSILIHLNVQNCRVVDVPVRAVYGIGEKSGIKHFNAFFKFSWYLFKAFIWRMYQKYIIRDFHPLIFFYGFGLLFFLIGLGLGAYLFAYRVFIGLVQSTSALFATFLFTSGLQLLLFAMWFDKDYIRR